MMKLTLIAAAVALTSFAGPDDSKKSPPPSTQPVNKMCAVMPDDAVDPAVTYVYKDETIGFCCKDCVPKFKANPERYMKNVKK